MSSHLDSNDITPIQSITQLMAKHESGEKPDSQFAIGIEHEKFGYVGSPLRPLQYKGKDGQAGIEDVLHSFQDDGWVPELDAGALIALISEDGSIALEPGGQLELSGAPHQILHETKKEFERHIKKLNALSERFHMDWLFAGSQPIHGFSDLDWMPKRRYGVMRGYLPQKGQMAQHMMQTTCTVQANLDFGSERDMGRKLQTSMGLASIVGALFANAPLTDGKPNGLKSLRQEIWFHTDPDRQGLLDFVLEDGLPSYEQYVRWALQVPMFFIVRNDAYLPANGQSFQDFMKRGFHSHPKEFPNMSDWELHLSTLFPDSRIKTYLETRTADCVPPRLAMALPALWKGLLYRDSALDAAWDLVKHWHMDERWEHRKAVVKDGHFAAIPGSKGLTGDLAREVLKMAHESLDLQAQEGGYESEAPYLEPLMALAEKNLSPGDAMLKLYEKGMPKETLLKRLIQYSNEQSVLT